MHAELAALCDIVIASATAEFQNSHFDWGVVPGDGCHVVWPMILGPNRGRHSLLTSQKIGAAEALRLGIVSELVEPQDLMARAQEIAAHISARPVLFTRYTRSLFPQPFKRALMDAPPWGLRSRVHRPSLSRCFEAVAHEPPIFDTWFAQKGARTALR